MVCILNVTDSAAMRMKNVLQCKNGFYIKIMVKSKGCMGLSYEIFVVNSIDGDDILVDNNGLSLLLEKKSLIFLLGTTIDFVNTNLKSGFIFLNPNERGRCGCGESFIV